MLSLPGLPHVFPEGWALKWLELQCTVITSKWFLLSKLLAHWLWTEFVNFFSSVMMTCYFFPVILSAAREITEWPLFWVSSLLPLQWHTQTHVEVKIESEVAQSCPTHCDPMDCSSSGSSVHGILQAGILEWVDISFFNVNFSSSTLVTKSCLTLAIPQTVAHQVPLSMGFCRQEYWSGLPFPSP